MQKFDEEKLDFRLHRRNINIGRKHFDDYQIIHQICQTFPLSNFYAIWYNAYVYELCDSIYK